MTHPVVLLTRPQEYCYKLTELLQKANVDALHLPLFKCQTLYSASAWLTQNQATLPDWLFVTSRYAAKWINEQLYNLLQLQPDLKLAAPGPGTAADLSALAGKDKVFYPKIPPYNSKNLLQNLQNICFKDRMVMIISGKDPHPWLTQKLQEKTKKCLIFHPYTRIPLKPKACDFRQIFLLNINLILITCLTSFKLLISYASEFNCQIKHIPLLLLSPSALEQAKKLGFQQTYLANTMEEEWLANKIAHLLKK